MGDMADLTLEHFEGEDDYFNNVMYFEEHDSYIGPGRYRKNPMCRYCGEQNLRWRKIENRWVLYEKKRPHICPKCPLPLDVLKKVAESNRMEYIAKKRENLLSRAHEKNGVEYLIKNGIKTPDLLYLLEVLAKEEDGDKTKLIREELLRRLK
jgi:hypothetical protein